MHDSTNADPTGRSLPQLLRDLTNSVSDLIRSEIALARAETSEKVSQAGTAAVSIAAGAVIGLAALLVVVQALVVALAEVMEPWLASVIVGLALAAIAWFMMRKGQNDLRATNLMPERTIQNVRRDAQVVADHASADHTHSHGGTRPAAPVATATTRHDATGELRR
jgi:ABC-type nickel/cobalt efflux system permease component RcnA